MDAPQEPAAETTPAEAKPSLAGRFMRPFSRLLHWTTASRLRMAVGSVVGLTLLGSVFAAWSLFGQLAEEAIEKDYALLALTALEEGRYGDAKSLIGEMQQTPASPEQLASALYVLGAVKAHEADEEPSFRQRRAMHEIAVHYLKQAINLGVQKEQKSHAMFLLGKSLVFSGQAQEAIQSLQNVLHDPALASTELHSLMVTALLDGKKPNLKAALRHNEQVLADPNLPDDQRQRASLISAHALMRLNRFNEARELLEQMAPSGTAAAERSLLLGRIYLEDAEQLPTDSTQRQELLSTAQERLQNAIDLDAVRNSVTREASLWIAKYLELSGKHQAAADEYERIAKVYPDSSAGLTAALAAADYRRRRGQIEQALTGYRIVLQAIDAQETYDDSLMPLEDVRQRMSAAYQQCIDQELFPEALTLVDLFQPAFGDAASMELRAKTEESWGMQRLRQAEGDRFASLDVQRDGRLHLRKAGQSHEALARMRFASRHFINDLWNAAECFFQGQGYTQAARLYEEYLHHESQRRNPMALLRLGQSRLALQRYDDALQAMEECIEMYPLDPLSHQARIECARVYWLQEKPNKAEAFLLENLSGETLTPDSPEWRDSLFELGNLLFVHGRHEEAINKLDEATKRYPNDKEALLARYAIARAYHAAASEPARRLAESKTENERQNAKNQMTELLIKAHENYQGVQRTLTLGGGDENAPLHRALLRNCYLLQGSVLFELKRYDEALKAYGNVITSYQSDPIALDCFVQAANCWRRLEQPVKARVTLDQAKLVLQEMPPDADFQAATNFTRQQWEFLLNQMSQW